MGFDPRHPHEQSHRDWTVLLCHPDGSVEGDDGCGLYHHDCRVLSRYRLTLNGTAPDHVSSGSPESDMWLASLRLGQPGPDPEGPALPHDAVEVQLRRLVGRGMVEEISLANHSMVGRTVELRIEVTGDFADSLEISQERRQQHGKTRAAATDDGAVALSYAATHEDWRTKRGLRMRVVNGSMELSAGRSGLTASAKVELDPKGSWRATLAYEPWVDGAWATADALTDAWGAVAADRTAWRGRRPSLRSSNATLARAFEIAADDLYALRNRELERGGRSWVLNAGVPSYTGLFGRDVLTCGWQSALIGPQLMRGALDVVARLQATEVDDWRDAEPGKLIHELRRGPFADLHVTAQSGYYGSQTTAAFFPVVLTELWHWTGDVRVLKRHRATAERALDWALRYGDLDGDGFLEYRQRSPVGIKNQGWKDSHEAVRYPDGGQVPNPIATAEEQAFHFLSLTRMAELCVALEDDEAAAGYEARARRLRDGWHAAYWMPDEKFYAMALDGEGRQVRSIGSNAGHALASGIVPAEHATAVADRLLAPDMFSGWGVRTLTSEHPSFNPWAYHLGTVWPVENATFALGFKRYGLEEHGDRLVAAMLDALERLPGMRLPELIGGQARADVPLPIAYPKANSPQAWSASATLQLVQAMLGLYPFAPLRALALVRPRLPEGIDELTLRDIRVGAARVSLRFGRRADGSAAHQVIARRGTLLVAEAPPPDALTHIGIAEAIASKVFARAPGRLARAARLALGMLDEG